MTAKPSIHAPQGAIHAGQAIHARSAIHLNFFREIKEISPKNV